LREELEGVQFLHLIRYEKDSREDDNFSEGDQWEGKIRAMKTKISKLDTTVTLTAKAINESINTSQQNTKKEMTDISTDVVDIKK
jgi:hypothetical protein